MMGLGSPGAGAALGALTTFCKAAGGGVAVMPAPIAGQLAEELGLGDGAPLVTVVPA